MTRKEKLLGLLEDHAGPVAGFLLERQLEWMGIDLERATESERRDAVRALAEGLFFPLVTGKEALAVQQSISEILR